MVLRSWLRGSAVDDGRKQPRLWMLYLLASGEVQSCREVAQLLGVHHHTIGYWLARYEAGGVEALLDVSIPTGKPLSGRSMR